MDIRARPNPSVLLTGAFGYLGKHLHLHLLRSGFEVIALGRRQLNSRNPCANVLDLSDRAALRRLFNEVEIDVVFHLAGSSDPAYSLLDPSPLYINNLSHTLTLLDAMKDAGIKKIIFPSSAGVYGDNSAEKLEESAPLAPQTPYARSKAMIETMLIDFEEAYGIRHACLRLFNPAGVNSSVNPPVRNALIPALMDALSNDREFSLYSGYNTDDGYSLRDFVHVDDACMAFQSAWQYLHETESSIIANIGRGVATSTAELVRQAQTVSGKTMRLRPLPPRAGDPGRLVANIDKAQSLLGWRPTLGLDDILKSAWSHSQRLQAPALASGANLPSAA
ncbi:NAD-dependent epimerase/dehydratase family protein [Undibacterium sp. TJN25]|uniref:NAD-dependent epimerase/dehydratase family protein n=1 Tax=Undibacterium sp. TJN25 TaxID=3413056 RepID=UPI003BF17420